VRFVDRTAASYPAPYPNSGHNGSPAKIGLNAAGVNETDSARPGERQEKSQLKQHISAFFASGASGGGVTFPQITG
jgi:hypothetical protein